MSLPRKSVPLLQGRSEEMSLEWYRALQTIDGGSSDDSTSSSGITLAQFNALQAQVTALSNKVNDYEGRIHALEIGYQS